MLTQGITVTTNHVLMKKTLLLLLLMFVSLGIFAIATAVSAPATIEYEREEVQEVAPQEKPTEEEKEDNSVLVLATITAYTSSVDETDDTPFITASGSTTGQGVIACPRKYPFGTQVEIQGELFVCEDRMNIRYEGQERFDIWMETKSEAYQWGVRELHIKVVS